MVSLLLDEIVIGNGTNFKEDRRGICHYKSVTGAGAKTVRSNLPLLFVLDLVFIFYRLCNTF